MARPKTVRRGDIPVTWPLYRINDRREQIDGILRQHDFGTFGQSAGLVDEIMTDDRIAAVTETRQAGLIASPFECRAASDGRKFRKVAELIGGDGADISGIWRDVVPPPVLGELLLWGWYLGFALAEIIWERSEKKWQPRLSVIHPIHVRWDWGLDRFVLLTPTGTVPLPRPDEEPEGDGQYFVWCPFGVKYGWRRGMIRSLAEKYLQRRWNERDWNRYGEKYGLAIVEAKVPTGADIQDKERFFEGAANLGNEPVIYSPQGAEGEASFGIELHEPTSQGWQTFKEMKLAVDTDIAVRLIGQNLTTEAKGGGLGGGEAKVHDLVRGDKKAQDAEIAPALRRQVFGWMVEANHGDRELTPVLEFVTAPEEDKKEKADAQAAVGQAVLALDAAGIPVDGDAMALDAGIPMLTPEAAAAKQAEKNQRAVDSATALAEAGGGAAGGDGDKKSPGAAADDKGKPPPKKPAKLRAPMSPASRYEFRGLPIAVENPAGSMRMWSSEDGRNIGSTRMLHDYGYVEGYLGEDGEELDCYIGPDASAQDVHIVHQLRAPDFKAHDEMKVFLGFPDAAAAKAAFLAHRNDGEQAFGAMLTMPLDRFKAKLRRRAPESTARIRASAVALKAPRITAGTGKVARYIDQLDAKAAAAGAKSMRPFLEAILATIDEVVAEGGTYDDVKVRAAGKLKASDGAALAQIARHSRIMGYLGGRAAVLDHHRRG